MYSWKCQTAAAAPAQPGDLPLLVSGMILVSNLEIEGQRGC